MRYKTYAILILFWGICVLFTTSCSQYDFKKDKEDLNRKEKKELFRKKQKQDSIYTWHEIEIERNISPQAAELMLPNGLKIGDFETNLSDIMGDTVGSEVKYSYADVKNAVIKEISKRALEFTKRENYQFRNEGSGKPAQNGLAFVYGSRVVDKRHLYTATPLGNNVGVSYSYCNDSLYGLDCSGYVYRIFNDSHIPLEVGQVRDYFQKTLIQDALKKALPKYNLITKDLGQIPMKNFQPGDFIIWNSTPFRFPYHMGIVLKSNILMVANSSGGPTTCERNVSVDGGPVIRSMKYISESFSKYGGYNILRIMPPDAWQINFRYAGMDYDLVLSEASLNLDENSLNKNIEIRGADYRNKPFKFVIDYTYTAQDQTLDVKVTTLVRNQKRRSDSTKIYLDKDNSEYRVMTKLIDNGESAVELRLSSSSYIEKTKNLPKMITTKRSLSANKIPNLSRSSALRGK
ncbi:MAG: hypothetical protein RL662_765 [Bacteroidota bacterium]|jgi:hypothetical protein